MYCKNCGTELNNKAVICPHCGVPTDIFYGAGTLGNADNIYGAPCKNGTVAEALNRGTEYTSQSEICAAPRSFQPENNATLVATPSQNKKTTTNIYGIVGFCISLACTLFGIFLLLNILGIVFSAIGINKSAKGDYGRDLAIAGLIVSICMLAAWIVVALIIGFAATFIYVILLLVAAGAA